jgi:hypothetical protein
MSVKIDAKLPKDFTDNGLAEVPHRDGDTVIVARLSAKSLETLFADDVDDDEILKLSIAEIEALNRDEAEEALKLLDRAKARRTGQAKLTGGTEAPGNGA